VLGLVSFVILIDFVVLSGVPGYIGLIETAFVTLLVGWPVFLANGKRREQA
jgi:hypothetical protein